MPTTDNAARQEAERRWPANSGLIRDYQQRIFHDVFVAGAEWQRNRPISDAEELVKVMDDLSKRKVTITITEPRCMACGQVGHKCPTGGRLLR